MLNVISAEWLLGVRKQLWVIFVVLPGISVMLDFPPWFIHVVFSSFWNAIAVYASINDFFILAQFKKDCFSSPFVLAYNSARLSTRTHIVRMARLSWIQGLYSLSGKTSFLQISWNLATTSLGVVLIVSLWNMTDILAALLPRWMQISPRSEISKPI